MTLLFLGLFNLVMPLIYPLETTKQLAHCVRSQTTHSASWVSAMAFNQVIASFAFWLLSLVTGTRLDCPIVKQMKRKLIFQKLKPRTQHAYLDLSYVASQPTLDTLPAELMQTVLSLVGYISSRNICQHILNAKTFLDTLQRLHVALQIFQEAQKSGGTTSISGG